MYNFQIGVRYNLQFLGSPILGTGLRNAKLVGTADYGMAATISSVTTTHASMIAYLPADVSRDATSLTYLVFETESGNRAAYAYPWIVESSIAISQNKTLTVSIPGIGADDAPKIKEILSLGGYRNISMSLT